MAEDDIIARLKENVIQGRKTQQDEGIDDKLSGTPGVVELTRLALEKNISPEEIIGALTAGMRVVGEKFSTKEYFIPDMLASAEAVGEAMDILKPLLEAANVETKGKFAIATVQEISMTLARISLPSCSKGRAMRCMTWVLMCLRKRLSGLSKKKTPITWGFQHCLPLP